MKFLNFCIAVLLICAHKVEVEVLVQTSSGPVVGVAADRATIFKGIPFAQAPVGPLRWEKPKPAMKWSMPRMAKAFGSPCLQPNFPISSDLIGNDDCLNLNVWVPARSNEALLPVIVFVHGGANTVGSTSDDIVGLQIYDGTNLARMANAVVITIQYRLGALGFMSHPELSASSGYNGSGNYGLMDILEALRWVNANAKAFGGNANNVTLMGESAGAMNALAVLASPLSKGLFHKLILESTFIPDIDLKTAETQGLQISKQIGCDNLACLKAKSSAEIISKTLPTAGQLSYYRAVVDHNVLEKPVFRSLAEQHSNIPVIIGTNRDEMRTLADKLIATVSNEKEYQQALNGIFGSELAQKISTRFPLPYWGLPQIHLERLLADAFLHCPTRKLAKTMAQSGHEVYRYVFTHRFDHPRYWQFGAGHGLELPYVFHNFLRKMTSREKILSEKMIRYWGNFVHNGSPNDQSQTEWTRFSNDEYLDLSLKPTSRSEFRKQECEFWDSSLNRVPTISL
jgi:para-nitrobenzyl esterase